MKELLIVLGALVLKTIFSKIIGDEFNAICPKLAHWLVKRSARWLVSDAERYEEEWLADLEARKTPTRKLLYAMGLPWSAAALRRESIRGRALKQRQSERSDIVERQADAPIELVPSKHAMDAAEFARILGAEWVVHSSAHDSGEDVAIYSADGRKIGSLQFKVNSRWTLRERSDAEVELFKAWHERNHP